MQTHKNVNYSYIYVVLIKENKPYSSFWVSMFFMWLERIVAM